MAKYNIVTDKVNNFFTNNKLTLASSQPTTGNWVKGDVVVSSVVSDSLFGWICTASGTPGSWMKLKSSDELTGDSNVESHYHDSRYYKKGEVDDRLNDKSNTNHNHDSLYHKVNDKAINVLKPPTGDYGFGYTDKPIGMIGNFPGWNSDCLYLNTYSHNGNETKTFTNVKIKGDNVTCDGNVASAGLIMHNNSTGLKAYNNNGTSTYHIAGIDGSNNMYLGWGNQTYIDVHNTTRFQRDIHMQNGSKIFAGSITVNNGNYSSLHLGPGNVRLEYAKGECAYIAGSETESGGYGTPFRAKHLESVNNYMKFGSYWLTIGTSASPSGWGDVWIQL